MAISNPTKVDFQVSPDHTPEAEYEIGFYPQGAADPLQVASLGTFASGPVATGNLNVGTLPFGQYTGRLRVKIAGEYSDWSVEASNPFGRAPMPPAFPTVRK